MMIQLTIRTFVLRAVMLLTLLASTHLACAFVHPGILNSQADLDRTKSKVAGGVQPWSGSFQALKANTSSSYQPSPVAAESAGVGQFQIRNDSTAAYQNAVMWYLTSDSAYSACAINIIDSWATTMTSFDPSDDISSYVSAAKFAAAGEILRYESGSGWTATHTAHLKSMLLDRLYPALVKSDGTLVANDGNQGIGCMRGIMAIGIFCDDTAKYNIAVNLYQGNANSIQPCVALTYYIDSNGCTGESGRDQAHPQGGLGSYAQVCKMAECQGLDLWSYASNRLLLGFEYIAQYNLGNSVAWTNHGTCYSQYSALSTVDRGRFSQIYDMAYNHYVVLKGLAAPYTAQVLNIIRPETQATDDPGWGTLLYTLNPTTSPTYSGTYKIINAGSSKAVGTVNNGTTQGANLEQRTYTSATTQQWKLIPLGNEYYQVINAGSPNTVAVDSGSSPSAAGKTVHLWNNGLGSNQIWKLTGSGSVRFTVRDTIVMDMPVVNLVWAILGSSTVASNADGALVQMNAVDNSSAASTQLFNLTPIYPRVAASSYNSQAGTSLETSAEGGQDVCFISNGDWTAYNGQNVSGATAIDFHVASNTSGGTIEVRQGSSTGTLLGTATVANTGGWQTYGTVSCPLSGATGTQNIYLVYKGGTGNLFNVLWFAFK